MKHLLYICLSISLLLSACSDNSEGNEQNKANQDSDSKVEQDQTTSEQADNNNGNNDNNDDDMFSMGDFETLKGKNDVGTYETGSVFFNIKSVTVQRGELNETFSNNATEGEIELVQILMKLNTTKKDINFTEENFQLSTNSGKTVIELEGFLSTSLLTDYAYTDTKDNPKDYFVTLTYILDEIKPETLQQVNLYVEPPTDQNGDPLGESIEIDIPLSE